MTPRDENLALILEDDKNEVPFHIWAKAQADFIFDNKEVVDARRYERRCASRDELEREEELRQQERDDLDQLNIAKGQGL